jgi:hypothetical protein
VFVRLFGSRGLSVHTEHTSLHLRPLCLRCWRVFRPFFQIQFWKVSCRTVAILVWENSRVECLWVRKAISSTHSYSIYSLFVTGRGSWKDHYPGDFTVWGLNCMSSGRDDCLLSPVTALSINIVSLVLLFKSMTMQSILYVSTSTSQASRRRVAATHGWWHHGVSKMVLSFFPFANKFLRYLQVEVLE